jgi:hypothetical protein
MIFLTLILMMLFIVFAVDTIQKRRNFTDNDK